MIHVEDVDAHCARARAAGAMIVDEPTVHDYGEDYWADRSYGAVDPEGHLWWFTQRIRDPRARRTDQLRSIKAHAERKVATGGK